MSHSPWHMTRWHQAPEVLDAAKKWKERCLLQDGSVLTDRRLWTPENFESLDRYFVRNLQFGEGDFYGKLEAQLGPAPAAAKQLAAEVLWVMFIFTSQSAMGGAVKRAQITKVWEWSGEPLPDSEAVREVLDRGVGHPGTAYNTHRWRELVFAIDAFRSWKDLPTAEQRRLADSPWGFAEWIETVPSSKNRQLRDILLYLLFPDTFERIATGRDKQALVRAFLLKEKKKPDAFNYDSRTLVDQEVKRIREVWSPTLGAENFDFYRQPARKEWKEGGQAPGPGRSEDTDLNAWFKGTFGANGVWAIAAGAGGRWWSDFQKHGLIAIGWDYLGDLSQYSQRDDIRKAMVELGQLEHDPVVDSLAVWNFAKEMKPGDHVFAKTGGRILLGHGVVTSEYRFDETRPEAQHARSIDWKRTGRWEVPEAHRITGKTLTDFGPYKEWLRMAWDLIYGEEPAPIHKPKPVTYTIDHAMADVFMPRDIFQNIVDALAAKKNVILEGAPGVGKTYVARRIAWALIQAQDSARVEMVQFHQSYAYEDFVQGWRPDGSGFRLQNGVFHRFCDRARKKPEQPFVFIIDEINRGNLSKVLGELMLLIEADKRGDAFAIPLAYSQGDDDRFCVPDNVHILGLMNTADRSLAMVDYALRRRFKFFRLEPAFESEAFTEVLTRRGVPESLVDRIRKAMGALNKDIREDHQALGPGFEIGHSFFVPSDDTDTLNESWYVSVIRGEIEPLLREYWFDQPDRVSNAVKGLLA